jgi:hypothetical protein
VRLYDDGGFSGAPTDRPALQRLLADIAAIGSHASASSRCLFSVKQPISSIGRSYQGCAPTLSAVR